MSETEANDQTRQLSISPAGFAALFDHVEEIVICCDADGTVRLASQAVRRVLGHDPTSLVGRNVTEFIHPHDVERVIGALLRWAHRPGTPRGQVIRVRAADRSWEPLHYDTAIGEGFGDIGTLVVTLRPEAAVNRTAEELRQRGLNEDRIVRLASAFLHVTTDAFDKGLDLAVSELAGLEIVTRVSVWRAQGDRIVRQAWWEAAVDAPKVALAPRIRIDDFELLRRARVGEEVHLSQPWNHGPEFEAERELFESAGTRSLLGMPMMAGGRFEGLIMLETTLNGDFGTTHVTAARSACAILAEAFARHDAELRLAEEARTDRVTGLGNRWAFDEALDRALTDVSTGASPGFGMAIVDLDRFKVINDSLGHAVGDQLLADVATRLTAAATDDVTLARLGADDLLVLAERSDNPTTTLDTIARLVDALAVPFDVGGQAMTVTVSVGVLHQPDATASPGDLLRWADLAVGRAKTHGGGTVVIDEPTARCGLSETLRRETELHQAVRDGTLTVHYQGEFDLDTGELIGAEALVRWPHPTEGLLAAGAFVPLAEASGLIDQLGRHVLRRACADAAAWDRASTGVPFVVRVNLAAHQLRQPDLVAEIADALDDAGLRPEALCLELTESTLLANPAGSAMLFAEIRDLGVGLAIDDFGTGYSSMLQLKALPLTGLKVDRSFVSGLPDSHTDRAIIRSTLGLAEALGIEVTAEGVETEQQRDALVELGCTRAQGFLLARPEPAADFAHRLDL